MAVNDWVARLARLDSCAVSDALDQLSLPSAVTGIAALAAPRRIAGTVVTVRLAAGKPAEGAPARHLGTLAIESAQRGDVIVVEQRTGIDCAGWGGILSTAARTRGIAGVIVEGPARDLDEAEQLGFPVYARSRTARTARGRIHEVETNATIEVGGVRVSAGDLVLADASGVVFVPAARAEALLAAAERIAAREALMAAAVQRGEPVTQIMGASYEKLLESRE